MAANPSVQPRDPRHKENRIAAPKMSESGREPSATDAVADQPIPTEPAASISSPEVTSAAGDIEPRHEAIARAAYFLAAARGFEPGHEVEDWLTAEKRIDS